MRRTPDTGCGCGRCAAPFRGVAIPASPRARRSGARSAAPPRPTVCCRVESKNLMPLSSYGLCEALMTTPKLQPSRCVMYAMPGVGRGPISITSTPAADEPRLERRFEHVARHARVLADQHAATVGRQAPAPPRSPAAVRNPPSSVPRQRGRAPHPCRRIASIHRSLQHRTHHSYGVPGGGDIVGSHHPRTHAHRPRGQTETTREPLRGRTAEHPPDQALARHADQQRRAQRGEVRASS